MQSRKQILPNAITVPQNYEDINVTDKIKAISDADGMEADDFGLCNNNINNPYCKYKSERWDFGFCAVSPIYPQPICLPVGLGDNHAGYIGFRNYTTDQLIDDGDGAMGVVVSHWN